MFSKELKTYLVGVLIITFSKGYPNDDSTEDNVTNQIQKLRSDLVSFEEYFGNSKNMANIIKELSSILSLVLSELVSTNSFQENIRAEIFHLSSQVNETRSSLNTRLIDIASTNSFQENIRAEISHLSSQVNETRSSLNTRLIDIENEIAIFNSEPAVKPTTTPAVPEVTQKPKFNEQYFFLTPPLNYMEAREYCLSHNGEPFTPKSKEGLHFIIETTTIEQQFGWVPLTDLDGEGSRKWNDGTGYNVFKLNFSDTDSNDGNTDEYDCVDINTSGSADWFTCNSKRRMLCVKTIFYMLKALSN